MSFEKQVDKDGAVVISKVEKLDTSNAPDLKSEFVFLNKSGVRNIIFDLSATKYSDSSGLSAILVGNRSCKNSGGNFVLCGLQNNVKKLIEISQLDKVLLINDSVNEAKKTLQELSSEQVSE